jgi:hypothetical protein
MLPWEHRPESLCLQEEPDRWEHKGAVTPIM